MGASLEQISIIRQHLTGIILRCGQERVAMRCGASHKTRDTATTQKNPAFGGATRLFGCVAMLARWPRIALRTAPARNSDLHPSNDSVWSKLALTCDKLALDFVGEVVISKCTNLVLFDGNGVFASCLNSIE
jgi:hypothetical protein